MIISVCIAEYGDEIINWDDSLPAVYNDRDELRKLWSDLYKGDNVYSCEFSMTDEELNKYLDTMRGKINKASVGKYDGLIVCLSGHGGDGYIECSNGNCILVGDIIAKFGKKHCPYLDNMPKLYFVDCCRGDGVLNEDDGKKMTGRTKRGGKERTKYTNITTSVWVHWATMSGKVAWTDDDDTMSVFSRMMIEKMRKLIPKGKTLTYISYESNDKVNKYTKGGQTSEFQTNLTYDIIFPQLF